jgi:signal transduction histidine kinase
LFVASLLIADRIARTLTRPLRELERTANELADGDFSARTQINDPVEIAHVGLAMNALARRIGELIIAEREAVADLSHRLRTPLTALRLDADSLVAPRERDRIASDIDLLERSLDDVIRTAARPITGTLVPVCDASAVVADRVAFWSALADDQGRRVTTEISAHPLWVRVTDADLAAAVDALLGNVFAHTDEGIAFAVRVHSGVSEQQQVQVEIHDEGPGLPSGLTVSGRGISGSGSTGLGLDIARRIAESSGGSLVVESAAPRGTRVRLSLGVTQKPD